MSRASETYTQLEPYLAYTDNFLSVVEPLEIITEMVEEFKVLDVSKPQHTWRQLSDQVKFLVACFIDGY